MTVSPPTTMHRLPSCKLNVYEHDVRVPLLVRGPGLAAGSVIDALGGNTSPWR
jgi:hypothetical protein